MTEQQGALCNETQPRHVSPNLIRDFSWYTLGNIFIFRIIKLNVILIDLNIYFLELHGCS